MAYRLGPKVDVDASDAPGWRRVGSAVALSLVDALGTDAELRIAPARTPSGAEIPQMAEVTWPFGRRRYVAVQAEVLEPERGLEGCASALRAILRRDPEGLDGPVLAAFLRYFELLDEPWTGQLEGVTREGDEAQTAWRRGVADGLSIEMSRVDALPPADGGPPPPVGWSLRARPRRRRCVIAVTLAGEVSVEET